MIRNLFILTLLLWTAIQSTHAEELFDETAKRSVVLVRASFSDNENGNQHVIGVVVDQIDDTKIALVYGKMLQPESTARRTKLEVLLDDDFVVEAEEFGYDKNTGLSLVKFSSYGGGEWQSIAVAPKPTTDSEKPLPVRVFALSEGDKNSENGPSMKKLDAKAIISRRGEIEIDVQLPEGPLGWVVVSNAIEPKLLGFVTGSRKATKPVVVTGPMTIDAFLAREILKFLKVELETTESAWKTWLEEYDDNRAGAMSRRFAKTVADLKKRIEEMKPAAAKHATEDALIEDNLKARYEKMRVQFGDNHPAVIAIEREVKFHAEKADRLKARYDKLRALLGDDDPAVIEMKAEIKAMESK